MRVQREREFHVQNLYLRKKMYKFFVLLLLTSCGDGGTAPTGAVTSGTAAAANIQLLVSSQQMLSSATASVTLTAVVLDGAGQALSGKAVTFSKGADTSAYFSGITALTSTNGVATATLNIGSDMSNRVITVTATSDAAVGTSTVKVAGTKIAISGNTSLALSGASVLTMIVKDSTGVAVPGLTLAVTSNNGNPIVLSPVTGVTDSTGQITATVTASNGGAGTDVLTVTGAGASQSQILTINNATFNFTAPTIVAPATTPEIRVNFPTLVTVHWSNASGNVVGQAVTFYTSRGTFSAGPFVTDSSGNVSATLTAASTGATIITASGPLGTPAATLNVVLITNTASTIVAQATPGTVGVNASGGTTNQSVISVVVRDASNNLVKGAHVSFSQVADASGGSLAAGSAFTDITGSTSINYIAGSISTGQNAVEIDATVDSVNNIAITPITAKIYLTVASQALYVRLGTDNTVQSPGAGGITTYSKVYSAVVSDAGGNPAPDGTQVRFVLRPSTTYLSFGKGRYVWGGTKWVVDVTAGVGIWCANEDANGNGVFDSTGPGNGEDLNGNGVFDPFGVATVNATALTTAGFATATITYAKSYATWVVDDLEARAGTVGNDPPAVITLGLPAAAADFTNQTVPPAFVISPYGEGVGVNQVCTNVF